MPSLNIVKLFEDDLFERCLFELNNAVAKNCQTVTIDTCTHPYMCHSFFFVHQWAKQKWKECGSYYTSVN